MNSNAAVVRAFKNQEVEEGRSLTSDGVSLLSYGWWEMARWVEGEVIVRVGGSYSNTTARHRNLVSGKQAVAISNPNTASMEL